MLLWWPMVKLDHVQDWIDLALGIWLCVSPWVLGFPDDMKLVAWSTIAVGAVVILVSTAAVAFPDPIEEWINIVLGVALIVSPWALGYSDHQVATMSAFVSGLLITGFATWALEHMTHLLSRMLGRQKTS